MAAGPSMGEKLRQRDRIASQIVVDTENDDIGR